MPFFNKAIYIPLYYIKVCHHRILCFYAVYTMFVNYYCCDVGGSLGSVRRSVSSSKLASLLSLFLMHRDLIFGRTVSMISIISMEDMLNGVKTTAGLFAVSVFSIIYLS